MMEGARKQSEIISGMNMCNQTSPLHRTPVQKPAMEEGLRMELWTSDTERQFPWTLAQDPEKSQWHQVV